MQHCTYFGSAPVSLTDYIASVDAQSLTKQHPTPEALARAFADLLFNEKMLDRLGPAINSGRGLFLYGAPGNGKTSIAERVTAAFGHDIWIPRAIGIDGEIIRLFDPVNHDEAPLPPQPGTHRPAPDRPPLGSHSPADDHRRRRTDHGVAGSHAQRARPASAKPRCNSRATAARW